jgi:hypothetical protein
VGPLSFRVDCRSVFSAQQQQGVLRSVVGGGGYWNLHLYGSVSPSRVELSELVTEVAKRDIAEVELGEEPKWGFAAMLAASIPLTARV